MPAMQNSREKFCFTLLLSHSIKYERLSIENYTLALVNASFRPKSAKNSERLIFPKKTHLTLSVQNLLLDPVF